MGPRVLDTEQQLEREAVIMDHALRYIDGAGIAALTMDKLVCEVPYSKGTVYNHFINKEDLLLALCNRAMRDFADKFERAAAFDGCSREKVLAMFFAFMLTARLKPIEFMLILTAKSANISEKASVQRSDEHLVAEDLIHKPLLSVFQSAMDSGELNPPVDMTVEQVIFVCWSLGFGTNALLLRGVERCTAIESLIIEREMLNNSNIVLDGLRFKPLSHEFDWSATIERLKTSTYLKETEQLLNRGVVLSI